MIREEKPSSHESINKIYEKLNEDDVTNPWDRWQTKNKLDAIFALRG